MNTLLAVFEPLKFTDDNNGGNVNGGGNVSSGSGGGNSTELNLNMTAAEMRQLIAQRKKQDIKKTQIDLKKKYEIIQQM